MPPQGWNRQSGTAKDANESNSTPPAAIPGDTFNNNSHGIFGGRNNQNQVSNLDGGGRTYEYLLLPKVPLEEFCNHYDIDDSDRQRLENMEYRPGDDLDHITSWRDEGFKENSWNRLKAVNQKFLRDVQEGVWNKYFKAKK